jgi:TrmH family RNA methyltransferase
LISIISSDRTLETENQTGGIPAAGRVILSRLFQRMHPSQEPIRSRSNPLVRRLRALKSGVEKGSDLALVEGVKLLEEAVASGLEVVEVAASPRALGDARARKAIEAARDRRAAVRTVAEDVLAFLSELETSQGVLALARRPAFSEEDLYRGVPLVVVAVEIQNPGNLGGLVRTAEAAGATGAILTRGCADLLSWKALRGAMGSAFRLPHVDGLDFDTALERLRARGLAIVAAAAEDGERYDTVDFRGPSALLLGNEGTGLPESALRRADTRAAIPMASAVESLNVGVAAGILLFEAARQRRPRPNSTPTSS